MNTPSGGGQPADTPRRLDGHGGSDAQGADTPEQVREQVEQTRLELGETIEALSAKADVTARAREKTAELRQRAAVATGELRQVAALGARAARDNRAAVLAAAGALALLLLAWRRAAD